MSLPTFIGSAHGTVNGTSKEVSYSSSVGNLLLVGIALNDGSSSVSGITDSAGVDTDSNPINTWSLISANTFNGARLEVWGCRAAVAITNFTVVIAATQEMTILIAEYSGNTFVSPVQAQVSRGQNGNVSEDITLWTSEPPPNSSCILVGFFSSLSDTLSGPSSPSVQNAPAGGTLRASAAESSPLVSLAVVDQATSDVNGDGQLSVGIVTGTTAESTPTDNVAASSLQCIALILSSGLTFTAIPGFSDVADAVFDAEQDAIGANIAKIANNAAFGMVRCEVFYGTYKNGDTIPTPVSPVDGYNYSRDELIYQWGIYTSANPATGWLTGPDSLWYCAWLVDQASGLVSTVEWYRRSGDNANPAQSNDGVLAVVTIAQRQKNALTMGTTPFFKNTDTSIYVQDAALAQSMLQDLSRNAKFGAINVEAIYMGEFVNGDVVPQPVSPVDGYEYTYSEVIFQPSWRWTTLNSNFTQPDMSLGQMGPMKATIDGSGNVSVSVAYIGSDSILGGGSLTTETSHGRIAVIALCSRLRNLDTTQLTVNGETLPWKNSGTLNTSYPIASFPAPHDDPTVYPVVAGNTLSIKYLSGTIVFRPGAGVPDSGKTADTTGNASVNTDFSASIMPSQFVAGNTVPTLGGSFPNALALICSFCDSTGALVAAPFCPGLEQDNITVPAGATQLQLGVNDAGSSSFPNSGSWTVQIQQTLSSVTIGLADSFEEIDLNDFMPGSVLPFSIMEQIDANAREASLTPEVFGPSDYSDGDTVPLPVSSTDGYKYARSELTYLFNWKDTTNQSGSHLRLPVFFGTVDQTSGLVTLNCYRLPPGGPVVDDGRSFAKITVVTIARRQAQLPISTSISANPPSDLSDITSDQGSGFTVN